MDVKSKVYVLLDGEGRILNVDGGYTESNIKNVDEWTLIDEGYGDRYNLCQNNYFPKPIMDNRWIYRYRACVLAVIPSDRQVIHMFNHGGKEWAIYERTQEEMDADYASRPAPPPSDKERIAQLEEELKAAKILLGLEV